MDLNHHFTVPTSVDDTWNHFQDIAGLAGCFPGAQVTSVEGDEFTGTCKVKLGPIALVYGGTGTFRERDEDAHRFVVEAKGKDKRGNGTATATAALTMTAADSGGTDVAVVTDLAITGKPAQFGRGLIQDVSDKLLGQFVACLQQQLSPAETAAPEASATPSAAPSAAPSTEADPVAAPEPAAGAPAPEPAPSAAAAPAAAAPAAVAPAAPAAPARPAPQQAEALDLGAAVLPVLVRSYWKPAVAGLAALAVVLRLVQRVRR